MQEEHEIILFSFVFIHVYRMLPSINMISGCEGWFLTNPSLLVQLIALLFIHFTANFTFGFNKEKRNKRNLTGGSFFEHIDVAHVLRRQSDRSLGQ